MGPDWGNYIPSPAPTQNVPTHCQLWMSCPNRTGPPQALQHGEGMLLSEEMHMTHATHRSPHRTYAWFPSCTLCHQLPPPPHC